MTSIKEKISVERILINVADVKIYLKYNRTSDIWTNVVVDDPDYAKIWISEGILNLIGNDRK